MKKHLKLLVLVLSLALIFGALAIAASAEGSTVSDTLTADDVASADGGKLTLTGHTTVTSTITVSKDLTIDLNGYTLTTTPEVAFSVNASCEFTVIGDGKLSLGGELLRSTGNSNDVTVNIEGNDGKAIVIEHSSNVGIRLLYVRHGTVNVSDVFITSDAVKNSGNANYAMFDSAASASEYGAIWNFDRVSIICESAVQLESNWSSTTLTGNSISSNTLFCIGGTESRAVLNDCYIRFLGHGFQASKTSGRTVQATAANAPKSYDYKLPLYNASGETGEYYYYTNVIEATNTTFDFHSDLSYRAPFIEATNDCKSTGNCYFDNCYIGINYSLSNTSWNAGQNAADKLNIVLDGGTTCRISKMNNAASDKGGPISNCDIHLKNAVILSESPAYMNRSGNLYITVGSRFATKPNTSGVTVYYDTDGTLLSTCTYKEITTGKGYTLSATGADVSFVFDPIGNPNAPWLVVKKGTAAPESLYTRADSYAFDYFDNMHFIHDSADAYNAAPDAHIYSVFAEDGTVKYELVSSAKSNNVYHDISKWWHATGNFGIAKNQDNSYLRWYVPANPAKPDATTWTLGKKADGTASSTPCFAPSPNSFDSGIYKVIVFEMAFTTETKMPNDIDIKLHTRMSNADKSFTAFNHTNGYLDPVSVVLNDGISKEDLRVKVNEWNTLTVVLYVDPSYNTLQSGINAGVQYWYYNGKQVGTIKAASNGATTSPAVMGFRWDLNDRTYNVGDTILFDNLGGRGYKSPIFEGECIGSVNANHTIATKGVHKPDLYVTEICDEHFFINDFTATVGTEGYYSVNEALEAARDSDFDVVLKKDSSEVITADAAGKIFTNGHALFVLDGSVSVFNDYGKESDGFATYAPDGKADVDRDGHSVKTVDPDKKIVYSFFAGNPSIAAQLSDPSYYDTREYYVGETAVIPEYSPYPLLTRSGKTLYQSAVKGWSTSTSGAVVSIDSEITEAFYLASFKAGTTERSFVPTLASKTKITAPIVIVNKNGFVRFTYSNNSGIWGSNTKTWNLGYGETVILNSNIGLCGSISVVGADPTLPREERVVGFDLNGYTLTYNPTDGDSDSQGIFSVFIGDTFNLYSSMSGGKIVTHGIEHTYPDGKNRVPVKNANYLIAISRPSSALSEAKLTLDALGSDYSATAALLERTDLPELTTEVNVGTAKAYDGVTYPGSNLTLNCDGIVNTERASKTATVSIDGITVNKISNANPLVYLNGFNGTLSFTDVDIRSAVNETCGRGILVDANDIYYVGANIRLKATVNVDNVTYFATTPGHELMTGEVGISKIHFTNVLTNGTICGDSSVLDTVFVGEGVSANLITDPRDPRAVSLDNGIKVLPYGVSYAAGKTTALSFVEKSYDSTKNSGTYTFTSSEVSIGSVTLPTLATANGVTLTVIGPDGSSVSREYAKGGIASKSDFEGAFGVYNGTVLNASFKGTFDGGKTTFPLTVNSNTIVKADAQPRSALSGLYSNLSLYSSFNVNVYIPKAYKSFITRVTLDGTVIELDTLPGTTINGAPYYVISAPRNASQVSDAVDVTLSLSDGGYNLNSTVTISVIDYTEAIMTGNYSDSEKALMKYIIAYAKATNDYFKLTDSKVNEAYTEIGSLDGFDKSYNTISAENNTALAKVFKNATVTLEGAAPAFRFTIADGYSGYVVINGISYNVKGGDRITISNIKAYNFLSDIKITAPGVNATYCFGNYAAYAYGSNQTLNSIIDGIWNYCYAANEFTSLPKYEVKLDANGGSAPSSISVIKNAPMTSIIPKKAGYTFLGWYNGETLWNSTDPVTSNMTLTAKWSVNSYTVSFDAAGGETSAKPFTVTYGDSVTLPDATFGARVFLGWFDGDKLVTSGSWSVAKNVTLVAKWDNSATSAKFTVAGSPLEDYTFVNDTHGKLGLYHPNIESFVDDLYRSTGIRLRSVKAESAAGVSKKLIVRSVDYAGETGFRVYVDSDKNLIVECAYENVFDSRFETFVREEILGNTDGITITDSYSYTLVANVLYYSEFGAVGDGVAEDFNAIYNTHVMANACGQKVMADKGATYFIHEFSKTVPVMTDVDWNGATFIIDDRGSEIYSKRGLDIFTLTTSAKTTVFTAEKIKQVFGDVSLSVGDTSIPWLADYIDVVSFVTVKNNHKDYIRHGSNINNGQGRQDILIINPDGTLDKDTPVIWDFKEGEQLINNGLSLNYVDTPAFTSITIVEANDKPITVGNATFYRYACDVVAETGFENKYVSYNRGIGVRRCNSTVQNVTHRMAYEPEFPVLTTYTDLYKDNSTKAQGSTEWKNFYGVDPVTPKLDVGKSTERYNIHQSYPYGGMIRFTSTYNSRAKDCNLSGRTVYYEAKTTSSTPIAMGSYDLHIFGSTHVYIENVNQLNDINDAHYWGIMNSNRAKNLFFTDTSISRFDAHEGFWNGRFVNCEFGRTINVIGGGHLYMNNVTRNVGAEYISLRGDYGSTFNGTIEMIDCTLTGTLTYRGSTDARKNLNYGSQNHYIINGMGSYSGSYSTQYVTGNAAAFPYLKWDFGYTTYLPQHVIIDNFTCKNANAKLFLYPDIKDQAFIRPDDLVKDHDWQGKTVTLTDGTTRPMTADDVYYNQYQITKTLVMRNNKQTIKMCPSSSLHLYKHLTSIVEYE